MVPLGQEAHLVELAEHFARPAARSEPLRVIAVLESIFPDASAY